VELFTRLTLNALIRELLNVDRDKHGAIRHVDERKQASFIIAQDPTVPTRELARRLDVDARYHIAMAQKSRV
jgi:hypothetical protein